MKIIGRLVKIHEPETFSSFTKQTIWVEETSGQYPNTFTIDMSGKALEFMKNFKQGDTVEVEVNVRGRYWNKNGKEGVFNSLSGWKIQKVGQESNQQGATQGPADNGGHPEGFQPVEDKYNDDLPF